MKALSNPICLRQSLVIVALATTTWAASAKDLWCENLSAVPTAVSSRVDQLAREAVDDSPNAIPQVRTEGLLPGQGLHDVSQNAKKDFPKVAALAYGWRTTGKKDYLDKARKFVVTWARTHRPDFNPIDETEFTQLFEGYALVRDDLAANDRTTVDKWLRRFYDGYLADMRQREATGNVQISNWQSHRIKIAAGAAIAAGDTSLLAALEPFYQKQLMANILDDGSTEDFHKRDSLAYSTYTLRQLVETALVTRAAGVPWAAPGSPARRRLMSGLDWMIPYASGEKKHIEYRNSTVRFDRVRIQAGVKGHEEAAWNPANARELFWLASYLDPKYTSVAQKIEPRPSSFLAACRGAAPQR